MLILPSGYITIVECQQPNGRNNRSNVVNGASQTAFKIPLMYSRAIILALVGLTFDLRAVYN
jgi:hypothetical protein